MVDVRGAILARVRGNPCCSVEELVSDVSRRLGVPRGRVAYEVMVLWREGLIELEGYPRGFGAFFLTIEGSWYWILTLLVALSMVVVFLANSPPWIYLRYALGSLMVLFLPGYALVEALYPRGDEVRPLERLALSIGLSLALVPLVGLVLNYTLGIRFVPIVLSLSVLTLSLLTLAAVRKAQYFAVRRGGCFE